MLAADDFVKEVQSISVCYTKNWDEVHIKGKFVSVIEEDSKSECVLSKWYYSIDIDKPTNIIISLHQDEDKLKFNESRKLMMDLSLSIMRRDGETNEIILVESVDFSIAPNLQIELNLNPGSYIIIPRTTGCFFGRPVDKPNIVPVPFYINKEEKVLHPIFVSTIKVKAR